MGSSTPARIQPGPLRIIGAIGAPTVAGMLVLLTEYFYFIPATKPPADTGSLHQESEHARLLREVEQTASRARQEAQDAKKEADEAKQGAHEAKLQIRQLRIVLILNIAFNLLILSGVILAIYRHSRRAISSTVITSHPSRAVNGCRGWVSPVVFGEKNNVDTSR